MGGRAFLHRRRSTFRRQAPRSRIGPDQEKRQRELEDAWERKMERELEAARAALAAIQKSTSWRLTKGLRVVADFLKGKHHGL